jgi:transposase InsO family protein
MFHNALLWLILVALASPLKSKCQLELENVALRHQVMVLRRQARGRMRLTNPDRLFLVQLYRWFPSILQVLAIIQPETVVRWHRAGFRCYWRWKSHWRGGRPQIDAELRSLIRRMSIENPICGAPRIHGELLKLGFSVAQSTVAKYMVKRWKPPSQGWRTFLRNHASDIAAMDLFVVPTLGFSLLYAFVIVRLDRRELIWINVTRNPTAEWIARQLTEAFPWDEAPGYLIRDNDRIYGDAALCRIRAMGIRDKPIAPAAPWQNGFAERLIGSIRRECLDHLVVLSEARLRRMLQSYADYYNKIRTHRSLAKDAPAFRSVHRIGNVASHAILGGLHHHYVRIYVFGTHRSSVFISVMGKIPQDRCVLLHSTRERATRQSRRPLKVPGVTSCGTAWHAKLCASSGSGY